jgi:DNA-binding PadR family transcriptional regulator
MSRRDGWGWPGHDEESSFAGRRRGRHHGPGPGGFGPGGPPGGGPGGWGGPPWGGPWPGLLQNLFGRNQRARRGDVRAAILILLDEEARNGYQLMQELERRSHGTWKPSSGSVYPTLQLLEDEGLVVAGKDDSNRVYKLTDRGKTYVAKHRDELGTPWEVDTSGGDPRWEVMRLLGELGPALAQVAKFGTAAQVDDARKIVLEARRALYRLLADDGDRGSTDDE